METAGWANNERPTYTWRANNKRGKVTRDNAVPLSRADNSRRRHRATLFSRRSPVCVCVCKRAVCRTGLEKRGDRDAGDVSLLIRGGKRLFRSGNGSPSPRFQRGKSFHERYKTWMETGILSFVSINYIHLFMLFPVIRCSKTCSFSRNLLSKNVEKKACDKLREN